MPVRKSVFRPPAHSASATLTASDELGEIGARVIACKLGGKKLPWVQGPKLSSLWSFSGDIRHPATTDALLWSLSVA